MITDYGLRLRASEMAIALRATDRQMADCFSSRVGFAQSTRELEECVAPVAPVVTPAPVIRSSPPVQTAPRAATPAPKPTASKPQTPAPRATTPAPTTQAPAAKPTPRPLMDMRLSPELYGESFFQ